MAYRRPAIEVIQEFQEAAAALGLPTLPAVVVGPGYQIADDVNSGIYSEDNLGSTTYGYTSLAVGAVVDTSSPPSDTAGANAHKAISVKLKSAYLVKQASVATGAMTTPNVFADATSSVFATIDPAASGAPVMYVDIISGSGLDPADIGRKRIISKTNDNHLVVAGEWVSSLPTSSVTYRIVEFRASETIDHADLAGHGITFDGSGVTIAAGLTAPSDGKVVTDADVYLSWRAILTPLAGALNVFTDLASLYAVFGTNGIVPSNPGAYALNLALLNTTTEVAFTGVDDTLYSDEENAFQEALDFLESKDVYAISILTQNTAVHQAARAHVEAMSVSTVGKERIAFVNRKMASTAIIAPPSGLGTVTSAGSGNGTSGTGNTTFRDPTNGAFITDGVAPGYFLEIASYTAVEGQQRAIAANERDYFSVADTPDTIRIGNGNFVSGDVGKWILVRDPTTVTNKKAFSITSVIDSKKIGTGVAPSANELMPAGCRTFIASLVRSVTHNAADAVVAATKVWHFVNGAFTGADVGRLFFVAGATAAGDNGVFTIASVTNSTDVVSVEAPGADETFGGGVTQSLYDLVREPARDVASDSVDGTSREFTILGGSFTSADVGRKLRIAGAVSSGNNADHVIEAVLSSSIVRVTNATTPVTEVFDGQAVSITITIRAATPNTAEAAFTTTTRHEIASVTSESQLILVSDPTNGFGGTLNAVHYTITRDLAKTDEADAIAGYSTSLGSRRVVHTWPDILAVAVNGTATKVPGYMAGAVLVGMVAGLPSQQGFTNMAVAGFVGRENSDDRFSDTQLDTIAGGGTLILTQAVAGAALEIRHQLTTDVSTIFFQELSVTKNVDLVTRFYRGHFKPYLGIYNITETLLDLLKTRFENGTSFLLHKRAPRVGAPLRRAQLRSIAESTTEPDSVEMGIDITVPIPFNKMTITLFI